MSGHPPYSWPVAPYREGVELRAVQAMATSDPLSRARAIKASVNEVEAFRRLIANRYAVSVHLAQRSGCSYATIQAALGISPARVQQLVARGRDILAAERAGSAA